MPIAVDDIADQPELPFLDCPRAPLPADLIRTELAARGISISEVAKAAGIDGGFLHAILSGRSPLSPLSGVRMALALGKQPRLFVLAQARHEAYLAAERQFSQRLPEKLPPLPSVTDATDAADLLRRQLKGHRLSIAAAAHAIGMSRTSLVLMINGQRPFSARADHLLCHWLALPPASFLLLQAPALGQARHEAYLAAERQFGRPLPQKLPPLPPVTDATDAADLLRRQLKGHSLSMATAARAIDMSRSGFVKLVNRERLFSARADHLLCHWLALPPASFLLLQARALADDAHADILATPGAAPRPVRPRASYGPHAPQRKYE